jgi:uroporphyrin-III C-methyltransferase/precorrin-2 dehydrogenase/sirohydrochlorin ferrochelatase/uroporphyrin-III C-methyltransferase
LKGGDPFVFGRGGEEALALVEAGISFEIVPGVTSAQACAAYAGIPLTHRGLARSVQFITGHFMKNSPLALGNSLIADPSQTVVVYMGLENAQTIVDAMLNAGRKPDTPAAIVENGTTPRQRKFTTTLEELPGLIQRCSIVAPAMLIIGDVVLLGNELQWFLPAGETDFEYGLALEKSHAFG